MQRQQQGYGEVEMVDDQSTRGPPQTSDLEYPKGSPFSATASISPHAAAAVPAGDDCEGAVTDCRGREEEPTLAAAGDRGGTGAKRQEQMLKDNDEDEEEQVLATPVTMAVVVVDAAETAAVVEPTLYSVIFTRKVAIFFAILLCSGVGSGVIDGFLFLRLQSLGASGALLGSARFIMCFAEIPCFRMAGFLHKRLGAFLLLAFCQLAFVVRFLWYAWLVDPVWVLPAEVLHGVTFAIVWSTGDK